MLKYARETEAKNLRKRINKMNLNLLRPNTLLKIVDKTYYEEINNGPISYIFWLGILGWLYLCIGKWNFIITDLPPSFESGLVYIFYSFPMAIGVGLYVPLFIFSLIMNALEVRQGKKPKIVKLSQSPLHGFLGSFAIGFLFIFPALLTPLMLVELVTTKPEAREWSLGETLGNSFALGTWISIALFSI